MFFFCGSLTKSKETYHYSVKIGGEGGSITLIGYTTHAVLYSAIQ